ncbi:hypothetical protein [Polymorphospora lycopeni]|uniref:DUF4276 family protein n=1 Tax=Polymorphospora lycopeni TaxID=3140240 RepID=A0ABV5CPW7_9ACTN
MHRGVFLGEGSTDDGISVHIERIATECGIGVQLTAPAADLLPTTDRTIAGKLRALARLGGRYDIVFVHRDADNAGRDARISEISSGISEVMPDAVRVPVVPVRMTEAWLVLDEGPIREVAGNPNGRVRLKIPTAREAERIADPKALLKELIADASETTGRRRKSLQAAFPYNRRRLLEELDPNGPVRFLDSWLHFVSDTIKGLQKLDQP